MYAPPRVRRWSGIILRTGEGHFLCTSTSSLRPAPSRELSRLPVQLSASPRSLLRAARGRLIPGRAAPMKRLFSSRSTARPRRPRQHVTYRPRRSSTHSRPMPTRACTRPPRRRTSARASVLRVDGAADPEIDSYLRFTVSVLAGSVQRATLRLHAIDATADGSRVSGTTNGWSESAMTWNVSSCPRDFRYRRRGSHSGKYLGRAGRDLAHSGERHLQLRPDRYTPRRRRLRLARIDEHEPETRTRARDAYHQCASQHVAADDLGGSPGGQHTDRSIRNVERQSADDVVSVSGGVVTPPARTA